MPYKKKIRILVAGAALLALVYALTLFFDPDRINARRASFTWLPPGARDEADRMEITRGDEKLELIFRNGLWYALLDTLEIPVKQGRVDDLFRLLGTRGAFPRRGSSAASHGELGLGDAAARLVIRGPGLPLLDLLVGKEDPSGKEVFLRKNGENEFRSGDKLIASYVNGGRSSWYDLKLFEEKPLDLVQRVRVNFTGPEGTNAYGIVRSGEGWILEGDSSAVDRDRAETWIRGILEAQGEDITAGGPGSPGTETAGPLTDPAGALADPADTLSGGDPAAGLMTDPFGGEAAGSGAFVPEIPLTGSVTVELGDGSSLSLRIEPGAGGKSSAVVSGKAYTFTLPQWTVSRILRDIRQAGNP
ncbi:MAG: DUF4340 domain-containing protein [Spirochaetaceae bacterium]|jgi:hypothetical protein|nr:DUF4340 domain-containing protein [Spirochaetaceae bacterium]